MTTLDRLRKKIEIVTNGYDAKGRRDWTDLIDRLEVEMKKKNGETPAAVEVVQVNVDEAKISLLEHEPVTVLTVTAFPQTESMKLAMMTGVSVAVTSTGKKAAARITKVTLVADKTKEGVVGARATLFVPGDVSSYVGILVLLRPLQRALPGTK